MAHGLSTADGGRYNAQGCRAVPPYGTHTGADLTAAQFALSRPSSGTSAHYAHPLQLVGRRAGGAQLRLGFLGAPL